MFTDPTRELDAVAVDERSRQTRSSTFVALLSRRLIRMLRIEFPGFDLHVHPPETRSTLLTGFFRKYTVLGWMDAWRWLEYSAAKVVCEYCDLEPGRTRSRCLAAYRVIEDYENAI